MPKLSARQEAHLVELLESGQYSTGEVAELFGVARSTVYRAQQRARVKSAPPAIAGGDITMATPNPDRRPRHAIVQ